MATAREWFVIHHTNCGMEYFTKRTPDVTFIRHWIPIRWMRDSGFVACL